MTGTLIVGILAAVVTFVLLRFAAKQPDRSVPIRA